MEPAPFDRQAAIKYGPWAVIAGASDGTGEAYARQLAHAGLNLLLIARREEKLERLAIALRDEYGVETRTLVQDLTRSDAGRAIIAAASDLDVGLYVSNAGSGHSGGSERVGAAFLDRTADQWRGMIALNVDTVFETTHGFASRMAKRGRGGIVLMSSMSALLGLPWLSLYSATKSFEANLAEGLWGEFRSAGLDIDMLSVLAPLMDTPTFQRTAGEDFTNEVGMILYRPEDIVRKALAHLPHGPLLLFPLHDGPNDLAEMTESRRARIVAQLTGDALK